MTTTRVEVLPSIGQEDNSPPPGYLRVLHPGYEEGTRTNVLLKLVATDGTPNAPGIQYGLVHTACAIIANNRFDGRLTTSRQLSAADEAEHCAFESLLPAGDYYFHVLPAIVVNGSPAPYAVVPNFANWRFPHNELPDQWKAVPIALGTQTRDITCRLTKHSSPVQAAHIIPKSEIDWFITNDMEEYAVDSVKRGQAVVHSTDNTMVLRHDLHALWDSARLSIVPKSDGDRWVWATHLNIWSAVQHVSYHNRPLQQLAGVQREYLFARFAWNLFPLLQPFLQKRVKRYLVVRDETGTNDICTDDLQPFCINQGRSSMGSRKSSSTQSKRMRTSDAAQDTFALDCEVCGLKDQDTQSFASDCEVCGSKDQELKEATNDASTSKRSSIESEVGIGKEGGMRRCEIFAWMREHEVETGRRTLKRQRVLVDEDMETELQVIHDSGNGQGLLYVVNN